MIEQSSQVTVAIIHHGYRDYLKSVLLHARENGNFTCLIGSEEKLMPLCDEFYLDSSIDLPRYAEFEKKYIHLSHNPEAFELLCFKRFYLLQYLVHQKDLSHIWMIDSDVLVMENLFEFTENYLLKNHYAASLSTRVQGDMELDSSTHCSFWTKAALDEFVLFLDRLYDSEFTPILLNKFDHHNKNHLDGGICDMTALYLWQKNTPLKVFNSANSHLNGLPFIDHNVNLERNYADNEFTLAPKIHIKQIEHQKIPQKNLKVKKVAVRSRANQVYPVLALHFSGNSKKYLPLFCQTYAIHSLSYLTYQFYKYVFKIKQLLQ